MRATWAAEVRELVAGVRRTLTGRDLAAASATLTYFSGIAVVPWLLLGVWTQTWWYGDAGAADRLTRLDVLVPPDMGGRAPYDALVTAGTGVGLIGALVLLFPASFYGEGLRRACLAVAPRPDTWTGWRARLAMVATAVVVPFLAWAWFAVGGVMRPAVPRGRRWWCRRPGAAHRDRVPRHLAGAGGGADVGCTAPSRPDGRAGGSPRSVGWPPRSFVAGFLQGFWLFLAIPIDVGLPFAGLGVVGGVVAVGLWLYVLHFLLLVGWVTTQGLDARVDRHRAPDEPVAA